METEARAWSQVFRDPALERDYQSDVAADGQRSFRFITTVYAVLWILLFLLDRQTSGSPGNYRTLLTVRYAVGLPVILASAACGWARATTFLRWKDPAIVGVLAMIIPPYLMALLVLEPQLYNGDRANGALTTVLVGTPCLCALWGLRFDVMLLLLAPITVFGSIATAIRYPSPAAGTMLFACIAAATTGSLCAAIIDRGKRDAFVAQRAVARERERSESLLRNMLPLAVATRLKTSAGRIAEQLDEVTVLFADIVGFTQLSAEISAAEVVDTLDEIFTEFDELAERHGLEKIKTIGDAYMVVGGAPTPREDHAEAVAAMALEMRDLLEGKRFVGGRRLSMRVGIHTGPVIAGVIGKKKFVYDLWGDTVNTASRMESHGVAGAVQVSEATFTRLQDSFLLTSRGTVDIKGKGPMSTWLLDGRRPTPEK